MDSTGKDTAQENTTNQLRPDESLPPFVAHQVTQESLDNASLSPNTAGEQYRRGRVEAETRRISDEVTREAQRRQREAQAEAEAAAARAAAPVFPPDTNLPAPAPMRQMLVPLDGSLLGERALPYAVTLARLLRAHLLLGHVTPTEPPALLGQIFGIDATRHQVEQQAFAPEALSYLRRVREWIATDGGQVDTLHTVAPAVADGLLQIEKSRDIDLVTLALDVGDTPGGMKVGRVADSLIRRGAAPILVVPPGADAGGRPFALRSLVVTLDGSPLAEQSLGPLMGILERIREAGGELPLVTLLAVAEDYSLQRDYQSYLDKLRETVAAMPPFNGVRLHATTVVGSAPGAIVGVANHGLGEVEEADEFHADVGVGSSPPDVLLMTTHGRGGMGRWLFGSVAHYVLPRAHIPVLLTRPGPFTKQ
jgi:nucleotide-binding universal stress UspA family protein